MIKLGDLNNLFPTKVHAVIFVGYMALFINQGLLVTATKGTDNKYTYNPTTAVLLAELLKLLVSSLLTIRNDGMGALFGGFKKHWRVMGLYMVPSLMYCIYNNLAFTNLRNFDPTTYFLLLQFRVVVTGVIFQIVFKKSLSRMQWFSLFLLTAGCIVKQLGPTPTINNGTAAVVADSKAILFNPALLLIILQIFCSCFAGVYNEYLLKGRGQEEEVPFMLQNVFMYADSIACNLVLLGYNGKLMDAVSTTGVNSILELKVVCVILNNAAIGITTALFLRSLNSILKTFASALELMFTAVLAWLIFGIPVSALTAVAIVIVSYATLLYAQHPVDNSRAPDPVKDDEGKSEQSV